MTPIPTYRTKIQRTDRILRDWVKQERLAFDRAPSLPLSDLSAMMPNKAKEQLGDFKPTDPIFRKMSSGFNNVSDIWIELMRFVGIEDFSAEQAIMGTVSVFLDNENVRVRLFPVRNDVSRDNSIKVFCLNEPDFQGIIKYEGDRLSVPSAIFDAVIQRRLNVYNQHCDRLADLLVIPGVSDEQGLLDNDFLESGWGSGLEAQAEEKALLESGKEMIAEIENDSINSAELEVERNEKARRDLYVEAMATAEDANALRMAEVYSGDLPDDNSDTEF